MPVALAAAPSATAECAQISSRRCKSVANSQRSTPSAAHSRASSPSANPLDRLNSNHTPHPRQSNPHSQRRATHVPLPRFPPWEVCVRRPPACAAPPSWGRHPQTFTSTDIARSEPLRANYSVTLKLGLTPPLGLLSTVRKPRCAAERLLSWGCLAAGR
jgi:hypothetical protein